jgi:predicted anti-sigma-YlaC factor YlaD
MKKERSFRPDKVGTTILHKLYISPSQRKTILKWSLYSLMLVLISVIQDVMLSNVRVLGATTELVPCGIFLICILEGAEGGSVFTLLAAWIYLYTGTPAGPYCIVFITMLGIGMSIFRQTYLQRGFGSAVLCVSICMILYEMAVFGIGLFLGETYPYRVLGFLVTALGSVLAVPVLYPVFLRIQAIGGEIWRE